MGLNNRLLGKVIAVAAVAAALAPALSTTAHADNPASITGRVSATPARYLAETVVYLRNVPGTFTPQNALVDQKSMAFVPHVLAVTAGDTVAFGNHDNVGHNVFSPDNEGFNLGTFPPGETRAYTFRRPNVGYAELCSLHPEMLGYVFVGQNPYHAVVDASGNFTIRNVPPGTYQLAVWNSKLKGTDQNVTVTAGQVTSVNVSISR